MKNLKIGPTDYSNSGFLDANTNKEIICAFKEHLCCPDCSACQIDKVGNNDNLSIICLRGDFIIGIINN